MAHPTDSLGISLCLRGIRIYSNCAVLVFIYSLSNAARSNRGLRKHKKSTTIVAVLFWRTRRDSNAQSPPSEGDALSN